MKRIMITDEIREAAKGQPEDMLGCTECGDDIVCHEWLEIDGDGRISACDRLPLGTADAVAWLLRVRKVGLEQANREFAG